MTKKVILCGTPEFVLPFFQSFLLAKEYEILGVITRAPKEKQGKKLEESPVAIWAKQNELYVLEVEKFNTDDKVANLLKQADAVIVFAFGQIISESLLTLPKYGFFNIHPSKLPDLRGPSPIQAAILRGDKKTAITLMKMNMKMDEGNIIAQEEFTLNPNHKINVVFYELSLWAANWVVEKMNTYFKSFKSDEQRHGVGSYCFLVKKEHYSIKEENIDQILNKIKALGFVILNYQGIGFKCFLARIAEPSDPINVNGVFPIFLQPNNKKLMHIYHFLNGLRKIK